MRVDHDKIDRVILRVNELDKLKAREGSLFEPLMNETLRYLIQGINDPDDIVSELKEDGFDLLQRNCNCIGLNTHCPSCYSFMEHETIVYNFVSDFCENLHMGEGLRSELGKMTTQGGAYFAEAVLFDPRSVLLFVK